MTEKDVFVIFTNEVKEEQVQKVKEFFESLGLTYDIGAPPPRPTR